MFKNANTSINIRYIFLSYIGNIEQYYENSIYINKGEN